jgi:hypothetical protein
VFEYECLCFLSKKGNLLSLYTVYYSILAVRPIYYNMPYAMRKLPNKKCYTVYNKVTHKVFSKCSSLEKAKKQLKLLRAIHYNRDFVPNATRSRRGSSTSLTKKRGKGARKTRRR